MGNEVYNYSSSYYKSGCGKDYSRGNGWEEVFAGHAAHIKNELGPGSVLDVGCAFGYLVEALRDLGVDAEGIDMSEYALSNVRADMREFCRRKSVTEPFGKTYDLITCIEVLEHLEQDEISAALNHMCEAADMILFSSTPFDYSEASHFSVHPPAYWAEQFAYRGFYHDIQYDCSYISPQAMLLRRGDKRSIDLIREYELVIFETHQNNVALRKKLIECSRKADMYKAAGQEKTDVIDKELNPLIRDLKNRIDQNEKEYHSKLLEQEAQQQKRWSEKETALGRKYLEREAELRKDMERREAVFRKSYGEEIRRRKALEERHYLSQQERKEFERLRIENRQLWDTLAVLRSSTMNNLFKNIATISLTAFLREKIAWGMENLRLLHKGKDFWAPVFDVDYYAAHNIDVQGAYGLNEKKILRHFIRKGMLEGRRGNEYFNINMYMACNPDLVELFKYDIRAYYLHYLTTGMKEGRRAI